MGKSRINRRFGLTVAVLILMVSLAFGQATQGENESNSELQIDIVVNADSGWPTRIVISGKVEQTAWLGVSLYPYNVQDYVTGGRHSTIELKKGIFRHEILIDTALLGGSFEVAIYGKKIDKVDCTKDYCYWCKKNGFHLDENLAYKSGLLTQLSGYSN